MRSASRIQTRFPRASILGWVLLSLTTTDPALAAPPDRSQVRPLPTLVSLTVEPEEILLRATNRQQQLLVTGRTADGKLIDVTHLCDMSSSDRAVLSVSEAVAHGRHDGTADVQVRLGKLSARVPVRVRDTGTYPPVHFHNDIVPLFSKLGCNNGGCHGKASGQNGFKLSVFGFDPQADHNALVKEGRGRRVLPALPERSLLLMKPTGQVAHAGGRRIETGSSDYDLLREWIKQGMPYGGDDAPNVVELRVCPTERVLGFAAEQQVLVTAVFSDGSTRDVTAAASYTTNASHVADVDRAGRIRTGQNPGEAALTVRYTGHVAAVRVRVPRPGAPNPYPNLAVNNKVDELVWAKLKTMGIVSSDLCDDATFVRRLHLDVLGTLPTPDQTRDFLANKDADRRKSLIDKVLDRPEYGDYWALKWSDILLVNRDKLGDRGAFELHRWLRDQFVCNRPYDRWVRELLTASGPSATNGPVNFFRAAATTEDMTKAVSQAFLGIRLECAQCHHHPFEKWGQEDFYGLAGFFNGVQRKAGTGEGELIYHTGFRPTLMPSTTRTVPTRPPGGPTLAETDDDPRKTLADWIIRADNPYFARLVVNRLWKHYLGRGLVEPEDDLRSTNPATNEPLLDYLAAELIAKRYDLKAVTRLILNSRTYQLSAVPNESNRDDEQDYSHYHVKRLPAEVLLDAISAVTESPESFPGRPRGTRAIELWDNRLPSYFLDIFGRSERTSPCECGRSGEPTMAQCLHLMNAPEVEKKIASGSGRVARLLKEKAGDEKIIEELCLAALGRLPGDKEKRSASKLFDKGPREQAAQDFLWALLNSYEFLFVQ
jgi:Protein of unknown function (DUF1553)/Protein of unknown function (DUF1549)